jgi:glycosyltransferase involved in cell wall biosynthesis
MSVLEAVGPECRSIWVIDDACPDGSGRWVEEHTRDPRVKVIYHEKNRGVGGAVKTGYQAALEAGADIIVKVDGDGQMDPRVVPRLVAPIVLGEADYAKGNRFYSFYGVRGMPGVRLFGNSVLSFLTKISSGYWRIFDPTNGFTAVHATALRQIEFKNIDERYFFESDMLINLGGARAVARDVPMDAFYGEEKSNLRIKSILGKFLFKHLRGLVKRIVYFYFLRDFNLGSIHLVAGFLLLGFGTFFGAVEWWKSLQSELPATTGTVMLAVLPIILGFQLLLSFISYDLANEPTVALQKVAASDSVARAQVDRALAK